MLINIINEFINPWINKIMGDINNVVNYNLEYDETGRLTLVKKDKVFDNEMVSITETMERKLTKRILKEGGMK